MRGSEFPLSVGWWDATRERRLLLQRCTECATAQFYPRTVCTACGATGLRWERAVGDGVIHSFTTVHHAPAGHEPPYVIALVRLAEGPLMLTRLVDGADVTHRCEMLVRLTWQPLEDGRNLPVFEAA